MAKFPLLLSPLLLLLLLLLLLPPAGGSGGLVGGEVDLAADAGRRRASPAPAAQRAGKDGKAGKAGELRDLLAGRFRWKVSPPLVGPADRPGNPCYSIKDPSVVFFGGRWHLFCTIRSEKRSHQVEYLSFADWKEAGATERHVLKVTDGYFCAPQVFYFEPHRKWYMILQVADESRNPSLQPAYCTSDDLANPDGWSRPTLLYADAHPDNVSMWIDFWVICDGQKAHLFFTSLDGRMWRAETALADFPLGWDRPRVVLQGDIFEASHTYRLKGTDQFLTLVEAQRGGGGPGWRYYKAYLADRLDGEWRPIADTWEQPFASLENTRQQGERWTESFSHGEFLRAGHDQKLEVDPANLRFLFQGVLDRDRAGKEYGQIPWRLGILEPAE